MFIFVNFKGKLSQNELGDIFLYYDISIYYYASLPSSEVGDEPMDEKNVHRLRICYFMLFVFRLNQYIPIPKDHGIYYSTFT